MQGSKNTHCGRFVEATDVSPGELSPYDSPHVDFMKRSSSSGVIPSSAMTCSCGIGLLCFTDSLAAFKSLSCLGSRGSLSIGALAIARETGSSIISSNPTTAEACLGASFSINSCARRFSLSPFPAMETFSVSTNTNVFLHFTWYVGLPAQYCSSDALQNLSRLDFSRRQVRNQLPICRQKVVLAQLFRHHPGDLFQPKRHGLSVRRRCRIESNLHFLHRGCLLIPHAPNLRAFRQRNPQLFAQLASQSSLRRLPVLPFSATYLPFHCRSISSPPLPTHQ